MNNLLVTFIILNIINVILQTSKSLITIKASKGTASIINAVAYGFYTIIVVYMMCSLPLLQKAFIIGVCNLIGVYICKDIEERLQKIKLWKIEVSIEKIFMQDFIKDLKALNISYTVLKTSNNSWCAVNLYAKDKEDSRNIKKICNRYYCKYFVSESKSL